MENFEIPRRRGRVIGLTIIPPTLPFLGKGFSNEKSPILLIGMNRVNGQKGEFPSARRPYRKIGLVLFPIDF
nr:hypothetical protein [Streptomyces antibioticus]